MRLSDDAPGMEEIKKMQLKAAIYIRMSTELQTESPENQAEQIREYADRYGIEIVREYTDLGISGMTAEHRDQFLAIFDDVKEGRNGFNVVLYLDDSRWGRFVDSREAEYYRMILEKKNIVCQACDKEFKLKKDFADRLLTMVKDESASEYCKQLSQKVWYGQANLVRKGYHQDGTAGFGLRRQLLDEQGKPKQQLKMGERKSLLTERVILVPGPQEEKDLVHWIYEKFTQDLYTEKEIADLLNERGWKTDFNRPWTADTVKQIISNEKYIGHNVFNRTSAKLKGKSVRNPEEQWIRKESAFEPLIDKEIFDAAQQIIFERHKKVSNEELLEKLNALYQQKGWLSAMVIDEAEGMPPSSLYRHRFGGLLRAYKLISYTPDRDYQFVEINRILRKIHEEAVSETVTKIETLSGRSIPFDRETGLLTVNHNLTASIVISRCFKTQAGSHRWKIRFDTGLKPDLTIAVRMDSSNEHIYDYYILPFLEFGSENLKLMEENTDLLDGFRFETLDYFWQMGVNVSLDKAA